MLPPRIPGGGPLSRGHATAKRVQRNLKVPPNSDPHIYPTRKCSPPPPHPSLDSDGQRGPGESPPSTDSDMAEKKSPTSPRTPLMRRGSRGISTASDLDGYPTRKWKQ
ncbi:LOW QUALITY PROTEIN: hypothetical protein PanWU01x14_211990 [Parasponia andersonii]|uniref:Uncharacterized protein n=1 Tax=Parasponia andersonii TaxID=3476 RepID=A0A2P5BT35_PARAD|nr:LOW QUALITY PROTEIN: hypothetical protein PanWU01x14_211990 [Parasponia andersonii]